LRRRGRELSLEDEAVSVEAERRIDELSSQAAAGPLSEARTREHAECFQRCWTRFEAESPTHAAVISWITQDGLTNEEISRLLDRSPGATREFISQCRKRARSYLAEWYELVFGEA